MNSQILLSTNNLPPDNKLPISAFVITFNEEAHIVDCIQSLDFCSEIIVIDSGSTDNTVQLAEQMGAKVIFNKFIGYRDQKQFALNQCRKDWAISLDADERITDKLKQFIQKLDFANSPIDGFEVRRLHIFQGKEIRHSGLYPDYKLRLFRRSKGKIIGENIHEVVSVDGKVEKLPYDVFHYSWKDKNDLFQKQLNYARRVGKNKYLKGEFASPLEAAIRGLYTFFYRYIIRLGFLDGYIGLYISYIMGLITFYKYMEINKLNKKSIKSPFPTNSLIRFILKPIQFIYSIIVQARLKLYECKIFPKKKLSIPVISVGNLTVGGSGKTPFTMWLARQLVEENNNVSILTRGYKSTINKNEIKIVQKDSEVNQLGDEPVLMRKSIESENIQIVVSPNRYKAGLNALDSFKSDYIILDDGFQHIQLERDLNICLIDCSDRYSGELLPLGSLRENTSGFERADLILLTRANINPLIKEKYLKLLHNKYAHKPLYELIETINEYTNLETGEKKQSLLGNRVLAFSGIGNPQQFYDSLQQNNIQLLNSFSFPDHHQYSIDDLSILGSHLNENKANILLTTEKDSVKLGELDIKTEIKLKIWIAVLQIKGIKYISGSPLSFNWNKLLTL